MCRSRWVFHCWVRGVVDGTVDPSIISRTPPIRPPIGRTSAGIKSSFLPRNFLAILLQRTRPGLERDSRGRGQKSHEQCDSTMAVHAEYNLDVAIGALMQRHFPSWNSEAVRQLQLRLGSRFCLSIPQDIQRPPSGVQSVNRSW